MSDTRDKHLEFLLGRRSIRIYSPGEIAPELVTAMLEAAMAAPSAMAKDPWRFVVIRQRQTLSALASVLPGGKMLASATLGILVCGDLDQALENHLSYLLQDCSAAIENLLLAAHALGLGACWVGVHPGENSIREVKRLLSLPSSVIPVAVIALGHPGEQLGARTRFNADYVRFETW